MRVLVCGGRDWTDRQAIENELRKLWDAGRRCCEECEEVVGSFTLIEGGATGADSIAKQVVEEWGVAKMDEGEPFYHIDSYPADWKKHGRAAGPLRNYQMLVEGKPDLVLAFWDGKSRGTKNMIDLARKVGVEVRIISPKVGG